ncbi:PLASMODESMATA CALLOSE-BINDING PROTEIN 2-like isoform X2 [Bidens hawaiensis]|uniref:PLASMODESMATA CALLOSE-BINDING PROTEIN 2-like isoform X2 n=1 Tax=Bidens hawaiensis TaxID=980011 RepID=UPI00404A4DB8
MNVIALVLPVLVFLVITGYSSASYCVCNTGASDTALQQNIDFACGAGADCKQISQNGPCYNPNTLRDHCNFAVNSYYQKKGQTALSCSFSGTATVTSSPPSGVNSACFSGTSSSSTPTNPTIAPPGTGTGTGTGTGNATGMGTGTGTNTGTGTGINVNPTTGGGISPSGSTGLNDNSGSVTIQQTTSGFMLLTLLIQGLVWSRLIQSSYNMM